MRKFKLVKDPMVDHSIFPNKNLTQDKTYEETKKPSVYDKLLECGGGCVKILTDDEQIAIIRPKGGCGWMSDGGWEEVTDNE